MCVCLCECVSFFGLYVLKVIKFYFPLILYVQLACGEHLCPISKIRVFQTFLNWSTVNTLQHRTVIWVALCFGCICYICFYLASQGYSLAITLPISCGKLCSFWGSNHWLIYPLHALVNISYWADWYSEYYSNYLQSFFPPKVLQWFWISDLGSLWVLHQISQSWVVFIIHFSHCLPWSY